MNCKILEAERRIPKEAGNQKSESPAPALLRRISIFGFLSALEFRPSDLF